MTAIHLDHRDRRAAALDRRVALDALHDATDWAFGLPRLWRRRMRDRAELARLDSHMLQDIGLTAGDRDFLANKPFWRE